MRKPQIYALAAVLTGLLVSPPFSQSSTMSTKGMVVSSHPLATQAGLEILKEGGNAFDAAVAVAATLAVVEPLMSGVGGVGGYALIYDAEKKEIRSLDFIGKAPAAAKLEDFNAGARLWDRAHPARDSYRAPLVPGSLAGWQSLLENYGTKDWADVFAAAIQYARDGFPMTAPVRGGFTDASFGGAVGRYPYGAEIFFNDGTAKAVGSIIRQPDLARTLERIAKGGPKEFYGGSLAEQIAAHFEANGGSLTVQDFADYNVRWLEPLKVRYRNFDVFSQPPGGSGMTVLQALNILERFDIESMGHNSANFIHHTVEALKLAMVDEDLFNSGKAESRVPLEELLSKEHASEKAGKLNEDQSQFYPVVAPGSGSPGHHTTHHVVADSSGNIVTMTQTLMLPSGVVVPETGILFNNGMSYFSLDPDDVNRIEGGSRPRFVMSPTIVLRNDEPVLALGSAGGWTIPQTILQVLLRVLDFNMDAQAAVSAPRFTLRFMGNSIPYAEGTDLELEKTFGEKLRSQLGEKGHRLRVPVRGIGGLQAIRIYPQTKVLSGGADGRRGSQAAGW